MSVEEKMHRTSDKQKQERQGREGESWERYKAEMLLEVAVIPQQSSEWSELKVTSKGGVRICLVNRNINEDWQWGEEGTTSVRGGESDVCVCSWLPCPHGCALDGSREQTHRQGVEGQRRVTLEQLRPEPKRGQDWEPLYVNPQLPTTHTHLGVGAAA